VISPFDKLRERLLRQAVPKFIEGQDTNVIRWLACRSRKTDTQIRDFNHPVEDEKLGVAVL
jgi:hypothetical protein